MRFSVRAGAVAFGVGALLFAGPSAGAASADEVRETAAGEKAAGHDTPFGCDDYSGLDAPTAEQPPAKHPRN